MLRLLRSLQLESAGLMLMLAAAIAIAVDNSPAAFLYDAFLSLPMEVRVGPLVLAKPLVLWINDGLMAVFFLLVGLEIKRELAVGNLSSPGSAGLPLFAALGGMVVPCAIYAAVAAGDERALRGFAIPAATDIAFTLGILSLLGPRVPVALKVFLTAVAILDDLGAIVLIALVYTDELSAWSLALAGAFGCVLFLLNRLRVERATPYVLAGVGLWICVLKSGVHATLAGVLVASAIPLRSRDGSWSPVERSESALHGPVTYFILPAFAFANAGVSLAGLEWQDLLAPVPLGILLGLFVGKPLGVLLASLLAVRVFGLRLPEGLTWRHAAGGAALCGIGFTMSLFLGGLAFEGVSHETGVRLGVIAGSILSGILGTAILRRAPPAPDPAREGTASALVAAGGAAASPGAAGRPA